MSRGPLTFRQRDVEAAIRAARATGCEIVRVEVDKAGKIAVITAREGLPSQPAPETTPANPWDEVFSDEGETKVRPRIP